MRASPSPVPEGEEDSPKPLADELLEVERGFWTNDPEQYRRRLADDAALVLPHTGLLGREDAVDAARAEVAEGRRWADVRLKALTARRLSHDVAVLVYKVFARWNYEERGSVSVASSVYVRREGDWKLALHQQCLDNS